MLTTKEKANEIMDHFIKLVSEGKIAPEEPTDSLTTFKLRGIQADYTLWKNGVVVDWASVTLNEEKLPINHKDFCQMIHNAYTHCKRKKLESDVDDVYDDLFNQEK